MKKRLHIIFSILCSLLIYSCSEDINIEKGIIDFTKGDYLEIKFTVPAEELIMTRGEQSLDDKKINNLTILVFNYEGTQLIQREDVASDYFSSYNSSNSNSFVYNLKVNKQNSGIIYAIANTKVKENTDILFNFIEDLGSNSTTVDNLEKLLNEDPYDYKRGLFMAGKGIISGNTISLTLARTAAKLTLKDITPDSSFELTGFSIYKSASHCYLTAGASESNKIYKDDESKITEATSLVGSDGSKRYYCYANPTQTFTETEGVVNYKNFIVIKGKYNGEQNYYAVTLSKNDEETGKIIENFNIEPNHWYEMEIYKVLGSGYKTIEEALSNPITNNILVNIHDHAGDVMSMVSDGLRELGVTSKVDLTSTTGSFVVKCYSSLEDEGLEENKCKPTIRIKDGKSWLSITGPEKITDITGGNQTEDNPGFQWRYNIKVSETMFGDDTAIVEVKWAGLTREVEVNYKSINSTLNLSNYYPVKMFAEQENGPGASFDDYWYLLSTIRGLQIGEMADGKIRNKGFHLAMPYDYPYWNYVYEIDFSNLESEPYYFIKDITAKVSGDQFLIDNTEWEWEGNNNYKPAPVTLKLKSEALGDYTYATGSITFTIEYEATDELTILTFDLYHTGFFHSYGNGLNLSDGYYEVIPMGEINGNQLYWLDRNLASSSNKMYINEGAQEYGDMGSAGYFYKIATYLVGKDPSIYDNICPPGYHIPSVAEWDAVRLSSNFKTNDIIQDGETLLATYYDTRDEKTGKVYFPRARFSTDTNDRFIWSDNGNAGEYGTGYYWTSSIPYGLENAQIGQWFNVLYIDENSSSYMNGNIQDQRMNVRCVAGTTAITETNKSINFNVNGATHVYLYKEGIDGTKTGLYTFPGKAIASTSEVEAINNYKDQYIPFSITSSYYANELKVLFAFVTEEGKITIISENGAQTLQEATGFEVISGGNYYFQWDSGMNNVIDKIVP